MLVPSGASLITCVSAPSASNTPFAIEDALPLEQSRPTLIFLYECVASDIK